MGLLSTITSAAGTLLGGDTLKDVGGIIDDLHMSGEEKAEAKQKLETILIQAEQAAQAQVSARTGAGGSRCRPPSAASTARRAGTASTGPGSW